MSQKRERTKVKGRMAGFGIERRPESGEVNGGELIVTGTLVVSMSVVLPVGDTVSLRWVWFGLV